jgi:hypothetical protein
MSRGWWTHGTKTTNSIHRRDTRDQHLTNMQRQGTPQTPAMGAHLAHPSRRHQIQHVGNHPGLDVKAGACCVVVRNVDLWAPPPSRRRRCTSRPTDGDDARSLRIQQRRQCEGSSQRAASKLHKCMDTVRAPQWTSRAQSSHGFTEALIDLQRQRHTQAEGGRTRPEPHARASPKCW